MRITAVKAEGGWDVYPESGMFQGKHIGRADGLSLRNVSLHKGEVSGEVTAVWGLEVYDPMIYNDPRTIRGLRIGFGFDMREQSSIEEGADGFVLSISKALIRRAKTMWVMGREMQVFGETPTLHA